MVSARGWLFVSSSLCSGCLWSGLALSRAWLLELAILFFALMCATIVAMIHDASPTLKRPVPRITARDWHDDHAAGD